MRGALSPCQGRRGSTKHSTAAASQGINPGSPEGKSGKKRTSRCCQNFAARVTARGCHYSTSAFPLPQVVEPFLAQQLLRLHGTLAEQLRSHGAVRKAIICVPGSACTQERQGGVCADLQHAHRACLHFPDLSVSPQGCSRPLSSFVDSRSSLSFGLLVHDAAPPI